MVRILLAFFGPVCLISTVVTTLARLRLGSQHLGHLFAFWGCMTGSLCTVTLFGLCSARKDRTYLPFWRVGLLVVFLTNIVGGISLFPDESSMFYELYRRIWSY